MGSKLIDETTHNAIDHSFTKAFDFDRIVTLDDTAITLFHLVLNVENIPEMTYPSGLSFRAHSSKLNLPATNDLTLASLHTFKPSLPSLDSLTILLLKA